MTAPIDDDDDPTATPFVHHFVGGVRHLAWVERWSTVIDPSSGEVRAAVPMADAADADHAVQDAHRGHREWSAWPPQGRARVIRRFRELLQAHLDELARLSALEGGPGDLSARDQISRALEVLQSFGDDAPRATEHFQDVGTTTGERSPQPPSGVAVAIAPADAPAPIPLRTLAPALASGCAVILKPSEQLASVSVRLAELLIEAGAPPGVLNVLHGDTEVIDALVAHPLVSDVGWS